MKKGLCLVLSLIMVLGVITSMPISVSATTYTYEDFSYTILSDGTIEIVDYTGASNAIIPPIIDGYSVSSIGDSSFSNKHLSTVEIHYGVSYIKDNAFSWNSSLSQIHIPNSVQSLGNNVFLNSSNVTVYCHSDSYIYQNYTSWRGATEHTYTTDYQTIKLPTCTTTGQRAKYCIYCGIYNSTQTISSLGHAYPNSWTLLSSATCTKKGLEKKTCTRCENFKYRYTDMLPHSPSNEWTIDIEPTCTTTGSKSHSCLVCGEKTDITTIDAISPETGCSFGLWQVEIEPTCTAEGIQSRVCAVCGNTEKVTIVRLPHISSDWITTLEPTCTELGKKVKNCTVCNTVVSSSTISATGHKYGEIESITPATCSKDGTGKHSCIDCGITEYVSIPQNHPHYEWIIDEEPTCTKKGLQHKKCTECGEVLETATIAKMPHTASFWFIETEATVYKAGSKHKECTECGEVLETAEIPQLKCSKPTLKSIENSEYGVLVKWGKVKGADKYYIYRKVKGGSYSRIGSTTNTYYTDKTAKSGKKYYYIVKAINEAGASSSSSALSKLYLADPTLNTPSSSTSGIGLRWSKVTGAEGYIIYRKTGSGSYTKLKTEKGVSNLSYVDKSAQKGKKYTYKVKAYKSKTYSAYSNTKTITDKY